MMRFWPRPLALLALFLPMVVLTLTPPSASAAHSGVVSAGAVPANLCTVNLKAQLDAIPLKQIIFPSDCSTEAYTQSPSKGGRIAVTSYGNQVFSVTVISGYSASFLVGIKQEYATEKGQVKVAVGSWGLGVANSDGVGLETEAHNVIVEINLTGSQTPPYPYPNYRSIEKGFVALAAAVLARV